MFTGQKRSTSSRKSKLSKFKKDSGGRGGSIKMMEKQINILRKEIDKKFKNDIGTVNKEMNDQYMNILKMTKL